MNISEIIEQDFFNFSESVHAEIYYIDKNGSPHHHFNARIVPFMPEMKNANNVILFHHFGSDIITAGQIGGYNCDIGLYLYLFSIDEHNNVKIDRRL